MTENNPLILPNSSRSILVGQTGTGKSTLETVLVENMPNLFVLDPKHQYESDRKPEFVVICHDADRLAKDCNRAHEQKKIFIFRPSIEMQEDMEEMNRVFAFIRQRGNTFLAIDELMNVVKGPATYPQNLKALYTMGRSLGIGVLGCTQRPSGIPLFTISECSYFYKFFLQLRRDQERMAEFMGDIVEEPKEYPRISAHDNEHTFYYKGPGMMQAKQYILNMNSEQVKNL